ncbi:MAG: ferric reductase-like transmembrane domain-containing protein [Nitrospirae bacterium]|nr:ferric reductase-like transmembrane domain-containing protein [Nitrospirota bacterium]
MENNKTWKIPKAVVALAFLAPFMYLIWAGLTSHLGADPVEKVLHTAGDWTFNFLLLAIAARTLSNLPYLKWISGYHKAAGLSAFFYATLHFLTYAAADQDFSISDIIEDATKHTRIIFGALAYLLIASSVVMMVPVILRRIGFTRIKGLHKAVVYPAATSAVIHYVWLVKKDVRTPLIYAAIFAALAVYRAITKLTGEKRPV